MHTIKWLSNFNSQNIIQMKATEQYFSVALYITLHKVVLTFESGINPSDEIDWVVICSYGTVNYAVQDGSNAWGWV